MTLSLGEFFKRFADDDACGAHLEAILWPGGPVRSKCEHAGWINDTRCAARPVGAQWHRPATRERSYHDELSHTEMRRSHDSQ